MTVSHATSTGNFRRPALILLSGLPGAGKTTFASCLLERTSAVVLESDAVRHEISGRPRYARDESRRVFRVMDERARAALIAGHDVVVDATNLTNRDRARFVQMTKQLAARLVVVRLVAPADVLLERLSGPRVGFSQAGPAVLDLMRTRPQPIAAPHFVADTSFNIEPTLTAVVRLLGE